jgi:hypothetical protein
VLAGDRDRLLQMLESYRTLAEQIHEPRATRRLLMTGLGFSAAELRSASSPEESAFPLSSRGRTPEPLSFFLQPRPNHRQARLCELEPCCIETLGLNIQV